MVARRPPRRYPRTWILPTEAPTQTFLSKIGVVQDNSILAAFAAKVGESVASMRAYGVAYGTSIRSTALREGYAGMTAGVGPYGLPSEARVNLSNVDAELVARLAAMYEAAPPEAKRGFAVISGYRTRAQQAEAWQRSRGGTLFAAAPPGASRHEKEPGEAIDIRDDTGWFHAHGKEFGLTWPVRGDYPHTQLDPRYRGPSVAHVTPLGAARIASDLVGGATVPEGMHAETVAALNEVAHRQGIDPAAIALMIHTESRWDPGAVTGRYRGLTQIGPEQPAWARLGRMSPAAQIRAYGDWLDYYDFRGKRAAAGVDFSRMTVAEQAAYLQGFQFAPNALGWQHAYGRGLVSVPTTETVQARVLGDTTLQAMTGYYQHLLEQYPPQYKNNLEFYKSGRVYPIPSDEEFNQLLQLFSPSTDPATNRGRINILRQLFQRFVESRRGPITHGKISDYGEQFLRWVDKQVGGGFYTPPTPSGEDSKLAGIPTEETLQLPKAPSLLVPAPAVAIKPITTEDLMPWLSDKEVHEIAMQVVRLQGEVAELRRRLGAVITYGRVTDVDEKKQLARIEMSTNDESQKSVWAPYTPGFGGAFKAVHHPSVGQNMTLISPNGEPAQGMLVPFTFNDQFPSPSSEAGTHVLGDLDKTRVEVKAGELNLTSTTISLKADKVILDATVYLGGSDASREVALKDTMDTSSDTLVSNLATKVFGK